MVVQRYKKNCQQNIVQMVGTLYTNNTCLMGKAPCDHTKSNKYFLLFKWLLPNSSFPVPVYCSSVFLYEQAIVKFICKRALVKRVRELDYDSLHPPFTTIHQQ